MKFVPIAIGERQGLSRLPRSSCLGAECRWLTHDENCSAAGKAGRVLRGGRQRHTEASRLSVLVQDVSPDGSAGSGTGDQRLLATPTGPPIETVVPRDADRWERRAGRHPDVPALPWWVAWSVASDRHSAACTRREYRARAIYLVALGGTLRSATPLSPYEVY